MYARVSKKIKNTFSRKTPCHSSHANRILISYPKTSSKFLFAKQQKLAVYRFVKRKKYYICTAYTISLTLHQN